MKKFRFNLPLIITLFGIFLLRLPTFFEPDWYGDEEIYLAIGQAVQRGAVLYRDIWDNKTPLLYLIYAIHPTLLWAKISAALFVLATCSGVYFLSKKLFSSQEKSTIFSLTTTILCGLLLSMPKFEGTIANAELYFTTTIVWATYCVYSLEGARKTLFKTIILGLLLSFSFYLKVPAIFDFLGIFLYLIVIKINDIKIHVFPYFTRPLIFSLLKDLTSLFLPIVLIFISTSLIIFSYFYLNNALSDFLTASFSQNGSYVAIDSGPFSSLSNPLFIKGIILLFSLIILIVLYVKRWISKELTLLSFWFAFSLYGALLSNRPYMHYLLQIIPASILLTSYVFINFKKYWWSIIPLFLVFNYLSQMFSGAFSLPTVPYYQNWLNYIEQKKSWDEYAKFFDSRTLVSYNIGNYIKNNTTPNDKIFVWADAASIYVLSNREPATKFIQSHHLTTIDPKNYDQIIDRLNTIKPKYILVSRPGHFSFPKLEELIKKNYKEATFFQDMHIYKIVDLAN